MNWIKGFINIGKYKMINTEKIDFITSVNNTDKFSGHFNIEGHNYWPLYKNFINREITLLLEIGTAYGGFAKFLKNNKYECKIVGAELDVKNHGQRHVLDCTDNNNLYDEMYFGDAFSKKFLDWNYEKSYKYDLIIEDADHGYDNQLWGLTNCEYLLKDNGVYVIEDIQSREIAYTLFQNMPIHLKKNSYIWDGTLSVGRYDDLCIVVDLR